MIKNSLSWLMGILLLPVLWSGCLPQKNINMLQTDLSSINAAKLKHPQLQIQKGDLLFIGVTSKDPASDVRYNLNNYYSGTSPGTSTASMLGHLVTAEGMITLPDIGSIKVEGLKTEQLSEIIREKLSKYLSDVVIAVRFLNFKITVLGEVARPATYQIPTEKISIVEALGLAGDLTVYGERAKVMVIREQDSTRQYGWVDLTKGDFFNSPYFFLQQNDVIYVYSNIKKFENTDQTTNKNVALITGIITSIAITITAISAITR